MMNKIIFIKDYLAKKEKEETEEILKTMMSSLSCPLRKPEGLPWLISKKLFNSNTAYLLAVIFNFVYIIIIAVLVFTYVLRI